jgi:hypothetical protein
MKKTLISLTLLIFTALSCGKRTPLPAAPRPAATAQAPARLASIPPDAHKITAANDAWPAVAAQGWSQPGPVSGPLNTAGAEDSPFVMPDGQTLYFFFTPDVRVPPEKQLLDGVTGIWVSHRVGNDWDEPQRIVLSDPDELALDGCEFVLGDLMYFCSARAGNQRPIDWHTAQWRNGEWTDWQNVSSQFSQPDEIGELHISADGHELYFGASLPNGLGGRDLWVSVRTGGMWGEPVNLGAGINSSGDEDRPYLSPDGRQLWFDGSSRKGYPGPAIFRSIRQADGTWGAAEEVISQFAGEPALTADGRLLYFVHPYFNADLSAMIEADIYVVEVP